MKKKIQVIAGKYLENIAMGLLPLPISAFLEAIKEYKNDDNDKKLNDQMLSQLGKEVEVLRVSAVVLVLNYLLDSDDIQYVSDLLEDYFSDDSIDSYIDTVDIYEDTCVINLMNDEKKDVVKEDIINDLVESFEKSGDSCPKVKSIYYYS